MSAKTVALAIEMSADASDVSAAFADIGRDAKAMGDDVDAASRTAQESADRMGSVADAADNLGSKTAQAAGGLGDLGGALSTVPGPLGDVGAGMESLAPALQGVTGAMDLVNLATSANVVANVRAKAATIASTVATKAAAVVSRVAAAGQWALNAALVANPVGLVIIAVLALVAAVVIAYKKSETFRAVVQAVMSAVKGYISTVVDIVTTLVSFVKDKAPAGFYALRDAAVGAAKFIADKVGPAFDVLTYPIQRIIDLVQDLLDKISSIDLPSLGDLNPFGKVSLPGPFGRATPATVGDPTTSAPTVDARTYITVDGSGIIDENAVAAAILELLQRNADRLGITLAGLGLTGTPVTP